MKLHMFTTFPSTSPRGLLAGALALLAAAALVAGCGGGGVGSGGTGGFASGPITGFGSVIVGGVRFDDRNAEVEDLDGQRRSRDELRLGMTVDIDSSAITNAATGATATANRIRFESELSGPVGLVDVAGGSFTLLGQRVTVDASTVFDEGLNGGLAGLNTGQPVEIYAVFDAAAQRYRATRVEPAAVALGLRLRGPLAAVDTTAQTLRVGSVSYRYAGASGVPAGLAAGQFVRLRLEAELLPTPRWVVRSFGTALRPWADADDVKVEGLITAFGSATSFSVNGRLVDASGAGLGGGAGLAAGVRVEVEGNLRGGVLRATRVVIKSDDEVRNRGFEIEGSITAVAAGGGGFVVRGVTVNTTRTDLRYENGTAAQLTVGRRVEVRGVLAADRRSVDATRISFR
ncbi:MAG: hypothetical protein C0505_02095 [Leptothrix sp. (in: Bacteria)]|nr:hypothetical protein [Leptothrix sp. (in: b-proteobacteria)]